MQKKMPLAGFLTNKEYFKNDEDKNSNGCR